MPFGLSVFVRALLVSCLGKNTEDSNRLGWERQLSYKNSLVNKMTYPAASSLCNGTFWWYTWIQNCLAIFRIQTAIKYLWKNLHVLLKDVFP